MNFFCKLLPPRATFVMDMTEAEMRLMQEHAAYWHDAVARGNVITFGMVADPSGPFGMGVVEFASEAEVLDFTDGDPTIRSGQGFAFEIHPMPMGAVRG
ncbi:MAG TPA: YciI family protein [Longimicrobium sp.]|jgi:uncharacterized protein YciI